MDDEEAFAARERRRLTKDKAKIACVTVGGARFGTGGFFEGEEAEEDPEDPEDDPEEKADPVGALLRGSSPVVAPSRSVVWPACGARWTRKELVSLPRTYPARRSPRWASRARARRLIRGPPGTGKTLAVKALIAHLARGPRPVTFFHRKGADCLGKYSGEAERNVRLLFSEAERRQPSVVFFDEVDAASRPRGEWGARAGGGDGSDQIHGFVVSTMLAVMDGLNPRGSVVVIGATNRPDAVDPAMSAGRAGRTREGGSGLPGPEARARAGGVQRGAAPATDARTTYATRSRRSRRRRTSSAALAAAARTRAIRRVAGRERSRGRRDARRARRAHERRARERIAPARAAASDRAPGGVGIDERGVGAGAAGGARRAGGDFLVGRRSVLPRVRLRVRRGDADAQAHARRRRGALQEARGARASGAADTRRTREEAVGFAHTGLTCPTCAPKSAACAARAGAELEARFDHGFAR